VPVVTGHLDRAVLDELAAALLRPQPAAPGAGRLGRPGGQVTARRQRAERAARQLIVARAADLLSGPGGLAAFLRTRLPDDLIASVSLPLDIGAATETIPVHLRRAVTARDRHCRFPGCHQPPAACHPHHIVPRAKGGRTSLSNLLLLCAFHHLIAVHRWGWGITLHPDGTVTATSPDRRRTLHSHGPPATAA
jgi:HNH endonuclease